MTAPAKEFPGSELLQPCDKPVIIMFHDKLSDVCRDFMPQVEKAIAYENDNSWGGKMRLVKIDVAEYGKMADLFGVQSLPTMVGFHGNKASVGVVGRVPHDMLMTFISQVQQFHKHNPPPPWLMTKAAAPEVSVNTGSTIKVMKPLKLGQKKTGWKWLR